MSSTFVAPLVGAWIEMIIIISMFKNVSSLPSWERGLKYRSWHQYTLRLQSLPSWERGLKYVKTFLVSALVLSRSPRGSVD